jgi:hypothetical protein
LEYLELHNRPKAEVHPGHKLKEEEEEKEEKGEKEKKRKRRVLRRAGVVTFQGITPVFVSTRDRTMRNHE